MYLVLINNYETFLNSTEVLNPPEVNEISEQINEEQQEMLAEVRANFFADLTSIWPLIDPSMTLPWLLYFQRDAHFQSLKTLTVEKASKQQTYSWFQVILRNNWPVDDPSMWRNWTLCFRMFVAFKIKLRHCINHSYPVSMLPTPDQKIKWRKNSKHYSMNLTN